MKFSIAIVVSNDTLLEKCLNSIPQDVPIIIILNFPSKEILDIIKKSNKQINCFTCNERNLGKLRQLAVDNCKTPCICFVDSDCVISDNLVNILENELEDNVAINIPLHFDYYNRETKTVSLCRKFTTPDNLLYMPFAFRINLQQIIGPLFNDKLIWGEDSDQRKRLAQKNLSYSISNSFVIHKALNYKEDLNSARKLGYGTFIQEQVLGNKRRNWFKDRSVILEIIGFFKCYKATHSFRASIYHFFKWRPNYKSGYWKTRRKYGIKNKNTNE